MYKVLIVDDEPWVLIGIRNTFPWEAMGFAIVAETTDPLEAFELIGRLKPDVVLTDIRMPELSGIELMKKARQEGIRSEFVIISGAADFHFAQEAIRLGCFDYLLKPLEFDESDKLLGRLFDRLEKNKLQSDMEFLDCVLRDPPQAKALLQSRGLRTEHPFYQAVLVASEQKELIYQVSGWLKDRSPVMIWPGANRLLAILNTDANLFPLIESAYLSFEGKESVSIGVSGISSSDGHLKKLIEEAYAASFVSFVAREAGAYLYRSGRNPEIRKRIQQMMAAARNRDLEELKLLLMTAPELFRNEQAGIQEAAFFWNQLVAYLKNNNCEELFEEEFEFMDYRQLAGKFEHVHAMCDYLVHSLAPNAKNENDIRDLNINNQFKELLHYVNAHFHEEMQLKELAQQFYINFTYCCDLFRKTTQMTFTEYVTNQRMTRAGQLLLDPELSISEVCEQVGYKDYYYFNKVFKKFYGVTPMNYKKSHLSYSR